MHSVRDGSAYVRLEVPLHGTGTIWIRPGWWWGGAQREGGGGKLTLEACLPSPTFVEQEKKGPTRWRRIFHRLLLPMSFSLAMILVFFGLFSYPIRGL